MPTSVGSIKAINISPHGRLLYALTISILFLWNIPLRLRSASHANSIQYPVQDPELTKMAEDDLLLWSSRASSRRKKVTYKVPDPSSLHNINRYLSIVHVSTQSGISFLNRFEHVRMLWFGCSLHRILHFLRAKQIDLDTYIVLNVGDEWVEGPDFPIFSKARVADANHSHDAADSAVEGARPGGGRDNIMIPYEELLWSYKPMLLNPMPQKKRQVVFRGGCTHLWRSEMVHRIRDAFASTPHYADVAVACEPNYTVLTPQEQSQVRCLLDFDGKSYSRRTAWYLETGSVVLRGGLIDDVLSRLARRLQHRQDTTSINKAAPPIVFWSADELVAAVEQCLHDDGWSQEVSRSATAFWSRYVQQGQAVWEGYLTHLLLEQSKRWSLVLSSKDHAYDQPKYDFFSMLSSTLVCPLIQDGAIPTGDAGELQWGFIVLAIGFSLFVLAVVYFCIVPWSVAILGNWTRHSHSLPLPVLRQQPRLFVPFGSLLQQGYLFPKPSPRRDE